MDNNEKTRSYKEDDENDESSFFRKGKNRRGETKERRDSERREFGLAVRICDSLGPISKELLGRLIRREHVPSSWIPPSRTPRYAEPT